MRTARIAAALALLGAAGGCLGDGGDLTLTVSQAVSMSPSFGQLNASNAQANVGSSGVVYFTASSKAGALRLALTGPLAAGDALDLSGPTNLLTLDVTTSGGWQSGGGRVAVDGIEPYRLRFVGIPMRADAGDVSGSFVFDGSGTFR